MSLILCSECNNCLAYTSLAYQFISTAIRLEKLKELEKKDDKPDVEKLMTVPDVFDDEGKILDDLGLKNMCCRIHTMTHNSLNDIMAKHLHPQTN